MGEESVAGMNVAVRMASKVTDFLVGVGELPAYKAIDREQERLAEELSGRLRRMFGDVNKKVLAGLIARRGIPASAMERQGFLNRYYTELFGEQVGEVIADASMRSAERGYGEMVRQMVGMDIGVSMANMPEYARRKLFERHLVFAESTYERIIGDVKTNLLESFDAGLGIDDAADRLAAEFDGMESHRLRTIARTEINSAQSAGKLQSMDDNDVEYKQWITAEDDRVRGDDPSDEADHIYLHGCVVRRGETFPNGLEYPGDRGGVIEEWINCRCTIVPYIPRRGEVIPQTPYWP